MKNKVRRKRNPTFMVQNHEKEVVKERKEKRERERVEKERSEQKRRN